MGNNANDPLRKKEWPNIIDAGPVLPKGFQEGPTEQMDEPPSDRMVIRKASDYPSSATQEYGCDRLIIGDRRVILETLQRQQDMPPSPDHRVMNDNVISLGSEETKDPMDRARQAKLGGHVSPDESVMRGKIMGISDTLPSHFSVNPPVIGTEEITHKLPFEKTELESQKQAFSVLLSDSPVHNPPKKETLTAELLDLKMSPNKIIRLFLADGLLGFLILNGDTLEFVSYQTQGKVNAKFRKLTVERMDFPKTNAFNNFIRAISKQQFTIQYFNGQWFIRDGCDDEKSSNGTQFDSVNIAPFTEKEHRKALMKKLFPEGVDKVQLQQGNVGDCCFLSALVALQHQPYAENIFYNLFKYNVDPKSGSWVIVFPGYPEHTIEVQESELKAKMVNDEGRKIRLVRSGALGICLLEKAWGKLIKKLKIEENQNRQKKGEESNPTIFMHREDPISPFDATHQVLDKKYAEKTSSHVFKALLGQKAITPFSLGVEPDSFGRGGLRPFNEDRNEGEMQVQVYSWLLHCAANPKNCLVTVGTKYSFAEGKRLEGDLNLVKNHAYAVTRIDTEAKKITLVNPWNTQEITTITFDQFFSNFASLMGVKLDPDLEEKPENFPLELARRNFKGLGGMTNKKQGWFGNVLGMFA